MANAYKPFKLTKDIAVKVCKDAVGGCKLTKNQGTRQGVTVYSGMLGGYIKVSVSDGWIQENGLISVELHDCGGGVSIQMFYKPKTLDSGTLERDFDAEDKYRAQCARVAREMAEG